VHNGLGAGNQQGSGSGGSIGDLRQGSAGHCVGGGGDGDRVLVVSKQVVVAIELSNNSGGDELLLLMNSQGRLGIVRPRVLLDVLLDRGGVHDMSRLSSGKVGINRFHDMGRSSVQKGSNGGNGGLVHHRNRGCRINWGSMDGSNRSVDWATFVGVSRHGLSGVQVELGVFQVVGQLVGDGWASGGGDVVQSLADVGVSNLGSRVDADGQIAGNAAGGGFIDGGRAMGVGLKGGDGPVAEGEAGGRVLGAVGDNGVESPQVGGVADAGLGTLLGQLHKVAAHGVVSNTCFGVTLMAAAS